MPAPSEKSVRTTQRAAIPFLAAVTAILLSSFFAFYRVWGFAWWVHYPPATRIILAATTLVLGLGLVYTVWKRYREDIPDISITAYRWLLFGLPALLAGAFYLLRARTHFLGDGYTLLSLMAAGHPVIKTRNYGGTLAPYIVSKLFGARTEASVETAYQVVSIFAGVLFIAITLHAAKRLFKKRLDRVLFVTGILVGGYSLQFFGYVENYSLFLVAVLAYAILGVLVAQKQASLWALVAMAALAAFMHIFGLLLFLPIGFLVLARTKLAPQMAASSTPTKLFISVISVFIGAVLISIAAWQSLAVRFALLPPVPTFYSFRDYTLFSPNHLIDYVNLLFMLVPSGVILLPLWWGRIGESFRRRPEMHFLFFCSAVAFSLVFILDPKPGMPRDWDLFSFAAIPLTVLLWLGWLRVRGNSRTAVTGTVLAILLGFVMLISRAAVLALPQAGTNMASLYIQLDQQKGRTGLFTLRQYYAKRGEVGLTAQLDTLRAQVFPEEGWLTQAAQLAEMGRWDLAKAYLDQARQRNSTLANLWLAYGTFYLDQGRFDSAEYYLKVSDAMVPYNGALYSEMGRFHLYQNRFDEAEKYLLRAAQLDTVSESPLYGLARLAFEQRNAARYIEYLQRAVAKNPRRAWMVKELGDAYRAMGDPLRAKKAYELALKAGLDSATYQSLITGL